ncbi:diadenylate cyclase [Streptomyces viridochromogenes]|uniref:diadenylate cyclase n=1 Tax=Streptomyces viridochromogenes TaxID=1938 RepID=UPI00099B9090|nr:diadenylate cyclase [Streptomyces viridochromogenes]
MAKRYIQQFMWGFQDIFRGALDSEAKTALEAVGFYGNPRATLIGFRVSGEHDFSICIEQNQDEDQFKQSDLASIKELALRKYQNNPESQGIHSDPRAHEMRQKYLLNRARADALEETLGALPGQKQRLFLSATSVRVGDYEVHVVISVDQSAVAAVPQITTTRRDRFSIRPSLLHAVLRRILSLARKSLYLPDPGSNMEALEPKAPEVIRTAAEAFMRDIMYCAGYWFGSNADTLMNTLSALPYEGRAGSGRLVFAKSNNPAINVAVKLRTPVDTRQSLAVRKLLEASGPEADVLSDGGNVYGLGVVKSDYDPNTETVFVVTFTSRGAWELSHAGVALLTVKDGTPSLPTHVLDEDYFISLVNRLFSDADKATLLEAARAAGKHRHGAMLVISADAAVEAQRLSPQSWSVEPARLSPELVTQLTDMDGAVLIDPTGHCHAIGVILDGTARGEGDPARGSRLNNAVRYLGSEPPPTIVVVYSADGDIDILPRLRPRVSKKDVDHAVVTYLALAVERPPSYKSASRAWDAVKAFEFYLGEAQCDALNDASNELEDWRMQNDGIRIEDRLVKPNPKMNDTYWL